MVETCGRMAVVIGRDLSEMTIEARTEGKVMMVTEKGGEEMTGSAVKGLNALTEMSVVKEGSAAIGKVVTEEIGAIATGVMSMTVEIETEDLTGTDLAQIRKVDLVTDVQDHDQRKEKANEQVVLIWPLLVPLFYLLPQSQV